jgi:hypothetical protein
MSSTSHYRALLSPRSLSLSALFSPQISVILRHLLPRRVSLTSPTPQTISPFRFPNCTVTYSLTHCRSPDTVSVTLYRHVSLASDLCSVLRRSPTATSTPEDIHCDRCQPLFRSNALTNTVLRSYLSSPSLFVSHIRRHSFAGNTSPSPASPGLTNLLNMSASTSPPPCSHTVNYTSHFLAQRHLMKSNYCFLKMHLILKQITSYTKPS